MQVLKFLRGALLLSLVLIFLSFGNPGCHAKSKGISFKDSVLTIGAGIRMIPSYAYKNREDIKEVKFERNSILRAIGEYAFLGCRNLRSITLPESLQKLGEGAFRECTSLDTLIIPDKVTALPKAMCSWDETLRYVSLPKCLLDIGSHAFAYCRNLQNVEIPRSVTHIGSNVFSGCRSLREVRLPANMKELESYAFSDCESLENATMPTNSNLLGELIFSGCVNLSELNVPSSVPPPFDCNSFIFEPDETALYRQCRLIVPKGTGNAYRRAPGWKLFFNISESE